MKRLHFFIVSSLGIILAISFWMMPFSRYIDGRIYDFTLRFSAVKKPSENIVIVGIDDETLGVIKKPLVLWHDQLAATIDAVAKGGAKRLLLDFVPAVSMDEISPDYDLRLMKSIQGAKRQGTQVFLGFAIGQHGLVPERKFAMVSSGLGFLNLFPDDDSSVRRQLLSESDQHGTIAYSAPWLLSGATDLKKAQKLNTTFIDYRREVHPSVSLLKVLELAKNGDTAALQDIFRDKMVILGVMSVRLHDVYQVPDLRHLSEQAFLPGVQILALITAAIEKGDVIRQVPLFFCLLLSFVFGLIFSFPFVYRPPTQALCIIPLLTIPLTYLPVLLLNYGWVIPGSLFIYGILFPATAGLVYRLAHEHQVQHSLKRFIRNYVSIDRIESLIENPGKRIKQERDLSRAVKNGEFVLHYQPKVDIQTGRMSGMEALVRWIKPDGTFISPAHFIPLAEESGLIRDLTEVILHQACSFAGSLASSTHKHDRDKLPVISVNLSARDLERDNLAKFLDSILTSHKIYPHQIDLEITESSIIHDIEETTRTIKGLQEMGFTISIDDFGCGYSSLGYLTQIPHDYLKIDKSLIDNITIDERASAVVKAIMAMAQGLQTRVVAEGVEDRGQLQQLHALHCDYIQGYFFSPPLHEDKIRQRIKSGYEYYDCNDDCNDDCGDDT